MFNMLKIKKFTIQEIIYIVYPLNKKLQFITYTYIVFLLVSLKIKCLH